MVDKAKIVDAVVGRGLTKSAAARELGVSAAYVGRVMKEHEASAQKEGVQVIAHDHAIDDARPEPVDPPPKWERTGGVLAYPEPNNAPPEDPEQRAWSLSPQDREQIHYGVVEMGNPADEVGACYGVSPEVVAFVVEIVSRERGAA